MEKAIFSRHDVYDETETTIEYLTYVEDILLHEDVQELKSYYQHLKTTRFQHSLNVSYYSFLLAKKFHLDAYSTARAGLLHDLYHYDWRDKEARPCEGRHSNVHPQVALENAQKHFEVNTTMEDCIVHHMWPMSIHHPKTKEGWLIQAVDKYCALSEIAVQSSRKLKTSHIAFYCLAIFTCIK